ncbi:MAG: FAD-binding oxidoreductase [Pseudomonadota bacterium]
MTRPDVLIVGAGINGLSTAYWLAKAGKSVTVVERGRVPCEIASSSDHHRLIRTFYGPDAGYTARIPDAFTAWRAMWQDLGPEDRYFADRGILSISQEPGDRPDQSRQTLDALGMPYERIDSQAEMDRRFPFLEPSNIAYAMLGPGGALMADNILRDLADWLRKSGVTIQEQSPVEAVDPVNATVTLVGGAELSADHVVVAAGVGLPKLTPWLDLSFAFNRSLILYADPPAHLAEAWANAPCWSSLGGDGELWGMPPLRGLPAKLGSGALGRLDPSDSDRTMSADDMQAMRRAYVSRFKDAEAFTIRWGQANYWTGTPSLDLLFSKQDRAYALSACSGHGFKFGALTGRDVADALTGAAPWQTVSDRIAGRSMAAA